MADQGHPDGGMQNESSSQKAIASRSKIGPRIHMTGIRQICYLTSCDAQGDVFILSDSAKSPPLHGLYA